MLVIIGVYVMVVDVRKLNVEYDQSGACLKWTLRKCHPIKISLLTAAAAV